MSRQRRFGIWLAVLGAIAGASIGYALEGVGLAIAEALAFLFAGVVAFRYVPEVLPPPPGSVVRPPIGQSPTAVRRRRTEGFAVLVAGVPMVVASVILSIGLPAGTGRLAAIVFAAVASIWLGFALVVTSAGGERLDRWRLRRYERTVERLREQRALYEQTVDPAVERAKQERLTRLLIACAVAPALVATALLPALLASLSSSPAISAVGAIASIVALAALAVWAIRR
jgi:hypothetical protein